MERYLFLHLLYGAVGLLIASEYQESGRSGFQALQSGFSGTSDVVNPPAAQKLRRVRRRERLTRLDELGFLQECEARSALYKAP